MWKTIYTRRIQLLKDRSPFVALSFIFCRSLCPPHLSGRAFPAGKVKLWVRKTFDLAVAAIALHATPKGVHRQMIDDLRKNKFACNHGPCPPAIQQKHGELGFSISSR